MKTYISPELLTLSYTMDVAVASTSGDDNYDIFENGYDGSNMFD